MAEMAKVCVTTRVVVGSKVLWTGGKLYDDSVTVKLVVDAALAKAAARAEHGLIFESVESFQSEQAMEQRGTELDCDDFGDTQVAHLRDSFGRWLKVCAAFDEAAAGPATPLPSGLQRLMGSQRLQPRKLPTSPTGERYNFRLFRALVANLERDGLSFPALDADQSGKHMLTALALALQYLLPFDDADPSPLRLDGRIHLVLPKRFKTQAH